MPEKPRRPTFDTDLTPVRVKDLKPVYDEEDETDSSDTKDGTGTSRKYTRQQQMSFSQEGEAIASYAPIYERTEAYLERESRVTLLGRPRECTAFDVFFAHAVRKLHRSELRAFKELRDIDNWNRFRRAAEAAFPDDETRRLSKTPISRGQYRRFMDRHILNDPEELMLLEDDSIETAIEAAVHIGLLDPSEGSFNKPEKTRVVYGDTSFVRGQFNASREEAIDKETGEIVRQFDRDAHPHTGNNESERDGSPGFTLKGLAIRNGHPNERILLVLTVKDPEVGEAEDFVNTVERMIRKHPKMRNNMIGVAYDMAIKPVHIDRLYRLGVIPFIKVTLTSRGKIAVFTIHDQKFNLPDGTTVPVAVDLVDGTPCVSFMDGEGDFYYQPLRRRVTRRVKNDAPIDDELDAFRWYGIWEVPENPLLGDLEGATTRIRLDSPLEETCSGTAKRTNALRAYPPSDPCFQKVFGVREDAESIFSNLKTPLIHGRAPCVGRDRFRIDLVGSQMVIAIRALIAWHERTGGDVSAFFGNRCPLPRDAPHDCG